MEIIGNFGNVNAPSNITGKVAETLTIQRGDVRFATQINKAFAVGMSVKISNSLNNWMFGALKEYNALTGITVVDVQATSGIGTYSVWDMYISTPYQGGAQEGTVSLNVLHATLATMQGVARYSPYRRITITGAVINMGVASSVDTKLDIKKNNISILNGEYLTLNANSFTSGAMGLTFSLDTTDSLSVDIVSAGGGKNLTLTLVYI